MSVPTLLPIKYSRAGNVAAPVLEVLNQRLIPYSFTFDAVRTVQDAHDAIKTMRVRGAPAIAIVAALSVAAHAFELRAGGALAGTDAVTQICAWLDYLATSRPTAVNLHTAVAELKSHVRDLKGQTNDTVIEQYTLLAEEMHRKDGADNAAIARFGAQDIMSRCKGPKVNVLTHCNTGALATSRIGTALGVVRALHRNDVLERCYCTETRPWNQGARLTYFELGYEKIPGTLIVDSAAAALMARGGIDAVIVGADRVCRNGDTANKVGTYSLALAAAAHGVLFYVAAPWTSIDLSLPYGSKIEIEEREGREITHNMQTGQRVAAEGETLSVWNPSFDVTPAALITGGIITERGVFRCDQLAGGLSQGKL